VQPARRLPTPLPEHPLPNVARLTEILDRHGVDYLVIGGIATQAYGAERPTGDFDCLVRRSTENFDRLAAAMRELNARLRVGGLSDDEAAALPVQLDGLTLSRSQISTWATDAGHLDVRVDMVNRQGHRQRYEDSKAPPKSSPLQVSRSEWPAWRTSSPRRSTPGAPKTMRRSPSSTGSVMAQRGSTLRAGSRARSALARPTRWCICGDDGRNRSACVGNDLPVAVVRRSRSGGLTGQPQLCYK